MFRPAGYVVRIGVLAALLLLLVVPAAHGDEYYYVLIFGAQRVPNRPKYSHSFATFVRAVGTGPCADTYWLEAHTISWLPATGNLCVRSLLPECGRNFDLDATLRHLYGNGDRVALWGPYQIDRDLYCRAVQQRTLLESGQVRYKVVDSGHRTDRVCNCVHALTGLVDGHRRHLLTPAWGEPASCMLSQQYEPWYIGGRCVHAWVASRLGLDRFPLDRSG
jgi:hypothetical protein